MATVEERVEGLQQKNDHLQKQVRDLQGSVMALNRRLTAIEHPDPAPSPVTVIRGVEYFEGDEVYDTCRPLRVRGRVTASQPYLDSLMVDFSESIGLYAVPYDSVALYARKEAS